ncbi:MAG: pyruvate kinase alpha/beta domain-containing protein [Planctomycetia bacterium]|nr:pyruvate kinase alpha/beta domain-containing protein [Planctomycetia bacterium]
MSETLYFDKGGPEHTVLALEVTKERAIEVCPEAVIVASICGNSAVKAGEIFEGTGIRVIAVSLQKGAWDPKYGSLDAGLAATARERGVEFMPDEPRCKLIDYDRPDVADAWRMVSQGFKVALQVASMCVDTGMIADGAEVIATGGSGAGTQTAIVVTIRG